MSAPLVNRAPQRHNEASSLRSPRDSDAVGRSWRKNRQTSDQVSDLVGNQGVLQRSINRLSRRAQTTDETARPFPFQVRVSPTPPSNGWRTFRVRAGKYGLADATGTDGADEDPYCTQVHPTPDYDAGIDFEVPAAEAQYYVWLDVSDPEAPVIDHGATEPTGGFWGTSFMLLAVIDTATYEDEERAVIRQLVAYDIPRC